MPEDMRMPWANLPPAAMPPHQTSASSPQLQAILQQVELVRLVWVRTQLQHR